MDRLIGTGGWAYFQVPGPDPLRAYARAFSFVEVNSTFYEHPDPRTVAAWRRRVPPSFRFALRAHRGLTHLGRLRATPNARTSLARTARLAERLRAVAIVLETPAGLPIGRVESEGLRDLLTATTLPCPVGLEARAYAGRNLPRFLAVAMEDLGVVDIVDFSRQPPRTEAPLVYGRLFGPGEGNRWEFTDKELLAAQDRAEGSGGRRVVYTFHGVRMYKDAGRFLTYVRMGKFPRATRSTGLRSLEEVLNEDARFPATQEELVGEHGWRVIDLTDDDRVHATALLDRLPPGRYGSAEAVTASLVPLARM